MASINDTLASYRVLAGIASGSFLFIRCLRVVVICRVLSVSRHTSIHWEQRVRSSAFAFFPVFVSGPLKRTVLATTKEGRAKTSEDVLLPSLHLYHRPPIQQTRASPNLRSTRRSYSRNRSRSSLPEDIFLLMLATNMTRGQIHQPLTGP